MVNTTYAIKIQTLREARLDYIVWGDRGPHHGVVLAEQNASKKIERRVRKVP